VPEIDSYVWWPARAALGDLTALAAVLGTSLLILGAAIVVFSAKFGDHAIAASSVAASGVRQAGRSGFRRAAPMRALRQKEWTLLRRDPWLVSQTLMQLLYLLPPALMLWRSYGERTDALVVLVPVLVMAAGQLAGGLAWLAISGEDAPDLVATAPILSRHIVRAKVEAGARRDRDRIHAVHCGADVPLGLRRARRGARHHGGGGRRHRHPVPLPQAGDAALLPPSPDRLALRHLRGSLLVDRVGRGRRARGRRHLVRADPGGDRRRHS
jgi:hypothetical protein